MCRSFQSCREPSGTRRPSWSRYAASLLSQGVAVSEVSAWLGHSSVSFTERYYADLLPDAPDRARLAIDGALGAVPRQRIVRPGMYATGMVALAR